MCNKCFLTKVDHCAGESGCISQVHLYKRLVLPELRLGRLVSRTLVVAVAILVSVNTVIVITVPVPVSVLAVVIGVFIILVIIVAVSIKIIRT